MNEDFFVNHILRLAPDEVHLEIPSLLDFLGAAAAPLRFEIGHPEDTIGLFPSQSGDIDMCVAEGLSRWIKQLRASIKPWALIRIDGAFEPSHAPERGRSVKSPIDTDFDLLVLRMSAYIMRRSLPEGLATQVKKIDRLILSLRVQSQRRSGLSIKAHIQLEDRDVERRLSNEHLADLTFRLQNCEIEIAQFMEAVLPWFQSSGVRRMDLAIRILPDAVYA